jgi:hypothetical protein
MVAQVYCHDDVSNAESSDKDDYDNGGDLPFK